MVTEIEKKVIDAKKASIALASVDTKTKDLALDAMASALDAARNSILKANAQDLTNAETLHSEGTLSQALLDRLKVTDSKIDGMIAGIRDVMELADPVGRTMDCLELDTGLDLYQVSCPIGLIGVIFESRPDVVPQVMSLCLKSGNAVILRGGSDAINFEKHCIPIVRSSISW